MEEEKIEREKEKLEKEVLKLKDFL